MVFYLADDGDLAREQALIVEYIQKNYDAALIYMEKFDYIREFYVEDQQTEEETIRNERGSLILLLLFNFW